MNTTATFQTESRFDSQGPATITQPRPMYWSVRRELWENRSVWIAPAAVAALVLFSFLISMTTLPRRMRDVALDPVKQRTSVIRPFTVASAPIMLSTFIIGFVYSLDAMYGERRDRSILFWKSLPVSDRTTVLSKAAIPMVVLPLIGLVLSAATQVLLFVFTAMILAGSGAAPLTLLDQLPFFEMLMVLVYGVGVHVLWFAPINGWFLLVSSWVRRAPILWALMPLLAIAAVEHLAFDNHVFMFMLQYRVMGAMTEAFSVQAPGKTAVIHFSQLDPARFFASTGLWVGLAYAALFLVMAMRLRRDREPI